MSMELSMSRFPSFAAGVFFCSVAFGQQNSIIQQGTFPPRWLSQGQRCMEIPEWQVHEYNSRLFILRQSPCSDYEKPFVFLFFGNDRALLLDTGAANGNIGPTLRRTIKLWLARNGRTSIPLVVVHTHAHGDHVAGDADVQSLHDPAIPVTFISADLEATKRFYGIANWPEDIGHVDLGGRVLDMVPIPGHTALSIALCDQETAILFAGDSLYPGRLYVDDFLAFQTSTERLIQFTAGKPVTHILGNHIEQRSTPFRDYPVGTVFQPDEHELALSRGALLELKDALVGMKGTPRRLALRDFSIFPANSITPAEIDETKAYVREQQKTMWNPLFKP
jgi:glyoxylase-like metal-dependent hydrolase (beta-lactamase superfamily II)